MVRREIELDEESDRLLDQLARDCGGDAGQALSELLHSRVEVEEFVEACEDEHRDLLLKQRVRAERESNQGFTPWEEVKRRHNL
jgi:hypothetical protein